MKTNKYFVLCLLFAFNCANATWVNIPYGGQLNAEILGFYDSQGNAVNGTSGVIGLGYFNSGVPATLSTTEIFNDFVVLHESNTFIANGSSSVSTSDQDLGNLTSFAPVVFVISNETTFADAGMASEFLFLRKSSWGNFVAGGADQLNTVSQDIRANTYLQSEVLFGNLLSGENYGAGSSGIGLATAPVPEPSSFALLAGVFGLAWVMVRRRD